MTTKRRLPSAPLALLALETALPGVGCPRDALRQLMRRFPGVRFQLVPFDPAGPRGIDGAEILWSFAITPAIVARAPRLRWFHATMTGPDASALPELVRRTIRVTTPRGVHAIPMAETALGLMLALARRIRDGIALQADETWGGSAILTANPPSTELFGKTVVIVGMGGIGTELARRCRALGMRVVGIVRRMRPCPRGVDRLVPFSRWRTTLPSADVIALACPLTKATRGMIGDRELRSMKRTALLINIARGALVDEEALLNALRRGRIAGAAADAFAVEPLPDGHPLYGAPNMIVMPHVAGWSDRYWERSLERFADNLTRYLKGRPLLGELDFTRDL